jgi:hypothetical protein
MISLIWMTLVVEVKSANRLSHNEHHECLRNLQIGSQIISTMNVLDLHIRSLFTVKTLKISAQIKCEKIRALFILAFNYFI